MVSIAELKTHLRIPHALDDAYLADLEAAAVSVVEHRHGYVGPSEIVTRWVRGTGDTDLWLPDAPNGEPLDPLVPAVIVTVVDADAAAVTDFTLRDNRLVREADWDHDTEYAVTFRRGYGPGMAPERVYHAIRFLVAHWYINRTPVSDANASEMPFTLDVLLPLPAVLA